jgi:hypothetical protein
MILTKTHLLRGHGIHPGKSTPWAEIEPTISESDIRLGIHFCIFESALPSTSRTKLSVMHLRQRTALASTNSHRRVMMTPARTHACA